ncbi:hypothetical protein LTS18_001210, partial [Coniosporium uncinatum]
AADVEVQYMFVGVEHEETVNLEFEGRKLEIVNVEAGRLGAKRTEWRLKPGHVNGDLDEQGQLKGEFINAAERLAKLVDDAAWNRLPRPPEQGKEKLHINVVVIGHVDSGKSTTTG